MANPAASVFEVVFVALNSEPVDVDPCCLEDSYDSFLVLLLEHLLEDELLEAEVEVDEPGRGDLLYSHAD